MFSLMYNQYFLTIVLYFQEMSKQDWLSLHLIKINTLSQPCLRLNKHLDLLYQELISQALNKIILVNPFYIQKNILVVIQLLKESMDCTMGLVYLSLILAQTQIFTQDLFLLQDKILFDKDQHQVNQTFIYFIIKFNYIYVLSLIIIKDFLLR